MIDAVIFYLQLVHLASQDLPQIMPYLLRTGAMLLQLATVCNAVADQEVGSKSSDFYLQLSRSFGSSDHDIGCSLQFVLHASFLSSFLLKHAVQEQQSHARKCYCTTDWRWLQCDFL